MKRDIVVPAVVAAIGAAVVGMVQPGLAEQVHAVKAREDVYLFPPPDELHLATLGYDSLAVDYIWTKLLVDYGIHWAEKRGFPDVTRYMDAIIALEPDFRPVYIYADILICYRPDGGTEKDARLARKYLERGITERANDHKVWLEYGQFMAFLSPSYITDTTELDDWRRIGAGAIAHSVELGGEASRALSAATLLTKYGQRDAAIRNLRRTYFLAEDPALREEIAMKLARLQATPDADAAQLDFQVIESEWRSRYPFVSRGVFVQVGPTHDPYACAGRERGRTPECAMDWSPLLPSSR